jgi:hypothetical protein
VNVPGESTNEFTGKCENRRTRLPGGARRATIQEPTLRCSVTCQGFHGDLGVCPGSQEMSREELLALVSAQAKTIEVLTARLDARESRGIAVHVCWASCNACTDGAHALCGGRTPPKRTEHQTPPRRDRRSCLLSGTTTRRSPPGTTSSCAAASATGPAQPASPRSGQARSGTVRIPPGPPARREDDEACREAARHGAARPEERRGFVCA